MSVVFRTDDIPPAERLDCWHELTARMLVPLENRVDQAADLRVEIDATSLGAVTVFTVDANPFESRRTAKLIRQTDPELYVLALGLNGLQRLVQDQREAALGPAGLAVVDTSRPIRAWLGADGEPTRLVALVFPHALLPLHPDAVKRLLAVPVAGRQGVGALVARYVAELARQAATCPPAVAGRLANATVDLLAALLADALDAGPALPPETRQRALLHQVHAFIQQHLGHPALSPDAIAAAHHVSTRSLHKLFQEQGLTIAGWIRDRRLERCRRDLADPALASWPIRAIAARWGLGSGPHFSRVFRAAYGVSPRDYRQMHLERSPGADGGRGSLRVVR